MRGVILDDDKCLETIKKIAFGYEYEEVQTQIEEGKKGEQKKKITKIKKYAPPNYQALRYLMSKDKKQTADLEKALKEYEARFDNGNK